MISIFADNSKNDLQMIHCQSEIVMIGNAALGASKFVLTRHYFVNYLAVNSVDN